MEKEQKLTFKGSNKEEAYEALEKSKIFITKKPNKEYFRFIYISINDGNTNHELSGGGYVDTSLKDIDDGYKRAKKMLDDCDNLSNFYISASLTKEK